MEKRKHVSPRFIRQCLLGLQDTEDVPFQEVSTSSASKKVQRWLSGGGSERGGAAAASSSSSSFSSSLPSAGDLAEYLLFSDMTPKSASVTSLGPKLLLRLANTVLYDPGELQYENKLRPYTTEAFASGSRSQAEALVYQSLLDTLMDDSLATLRPSDYAQYQREQHSVFDLRPLLPPVQHQGLSSDCTAHAIQSGLVAARAAHLYHTNSALSAEDVRSDMSASMPSRAYISALYKQYFGPVLPNVNMLTQWTYGISDSALCTASMGVPTESHFTYPSLYEASFRSLSVTEDQLVEFAQKLLGDVGPALAQQAERGPYAGWAVAPVVFPGEVSSFRRGVFQTAGAPRDSPQQARERVVLIESFLAALQPVLLSFPVYSSFRPFQSDIYTKPDSRSTYQGFNHSVCLVGYDRENQWFVVRDNYGEDVGTQGYWYLPYETFEWFQTASASWVGLGACTLVPPRSSRDGKRLK